MAALLQVEYGEHLRVVGSHELLGGWEVAAAPELRWNKGDVWTATLQLPAGAQFEYKFVHVMPNRCIAEGCLEGAYFSAF